LAPFENARENVQPNLAGRDGELGRELERMRVLLARVSARIESVRKEDRRDADGEAMDVVT